MQPALEYLLSGLYKNAPDDFTAFHTHVKTVEEAFDFTLEELQNLKAMASKVNMQIGPYCWKHVDIEHGVLLENVDAGTVLMTHKPVIIMAGNLRDSDMYHYAQAFYLAFITWPTETINKLASLYNAIILKNQETMDSYSLAASLAITWADDLLPEVSRSNEEWNRRFAVFGILSTKCIPCPQACGHVLVMGPDYFEQVNDCTEPNSMVTPHLWSIPFGGFAHQPELCKAHFRNQVTFAGQHIAAGQFVSIPMQNPFVITDHPAHLNHNSASNMCRSVLEMGTMKMDDVALRKTLHDLTTVVEIQLKTAQEETRAEKNRGWTSPFTSVGITSAMALCNVIQQVDPDTAIPAITVIANMIPFLRLPWNAWYVVMLLDMQNAEYAHSAFDVWRTALHQEAQARWSNIDILCEQVKTLMY